MESLPITTTEPLTWFTFRDRLRRKWTVYLSCPAVNSELGAQDDESVYGVTFGTARAIFVDIRLPVATIDDVAFHEIVHACVNERDGVSGYDMEEVAVRLVSSPMYHVFRDTKNPFFFTLPEKPLTFTKYRRWAIRHGGAQAQTQTVEVLVAE